MRVLPYSYFVSSNSLELDFSRSRKVCGFFLSCFFYYSALVAHTTKLTGMQVCERRIGYRRSPMYGPPAFRMLSMTMRKSSWMPSV